MTAPAHSALATKSGLAALFSSDPFQGELPAERVKALTAENAAEYDSYCLSPAYYLLTGREGLHVRDDGRRALVVCAHPNSEDELLVFPPVGPGPDDHELLIDSVRRLIEAGCEPRLARFTSVQARRLADVCREWDPHPVEEDLLDWRYPVRVLSTDEVLTRNGGRFERLRQRLRKIDRDRVLVSELDATSRRNEIEELATKWASRGRGQMLTPDQFLAPVRRLLELVSNPASPVTGQLLLEKSTGALLGYGVWEPPVRPDLPANQFAAVCDHSVAGLSELQIVLMCERLHADGIREMSLGGSETRSLDRFKRKFGPSRSLEVFSLRVNSAAGATT